MVKLGMLPGCCFYAVFYRLDVLGASACWLGFDNEREGMGELDLFGEDDRCHMVLRSMFRKTPKQAY